MLKRMNLCLAGALAIVLQLFAAGSAWAYGLSLTATAVCTPNGAAAITYAVGSWALDARATNPQIEIRFDGLLVDTEAFLVSNGNSFTDSAAAQTVQGTVVVNVLAAGTWGDGGDPGQSISVAVPIPTNCVAPGIGRFTGGGKQVIVGGADVTRGLTIHCDLRLSNNLEVNWGGNRFHMTEHLTTVACTDDPNIFQTPPKAPLDTLIGTGTGRYNGADGYTIQFTLVDAGEPGSSDKMAIRIFQTSNPANVVLNVPLQFMTTGNLQAHYDQPHRRQ